MKKSKKTIDSNYFIGKRYYHDDESQNYLIFQPVFKYFQMFSGAFDTILG